MRERPSWSGAALAAIGIWIVMPVPQATAQTPAGRLRCDVSARTSLDDGTNRLDVATNRVVSCIYRRPRAPLEFYYGYTGFVALNAGGKGAAAFYDVLSSDPKGLATLQGEFNAPFLWPGPALAGALPNPAALQLVPAPPPPDSVATNVTAAISHLHLNYAGVLHAGSRGPEGTRFVPAAR